EFKKKCRHSPSHILFARNEEFLRLYTQDEPVNWAWQTSVPFSSFKLLGMSNDVLMLFTSDANNFRARHLTKFNISTRKIEWQQEIDSQQLWQLSPVRGRSLAMHMGDVIDRDRKDSIRCYDTESGEEVMVMYL
ncbi:hypothetical protein PFISCL1PPCAC_17089, partial [Pristionchus fissidentatus]